MTKGKRARQVVPYFEQFHCEALACEVRTFFRFPYGFPYSRLQQQAFEEAEPNGGASGVTEKWCC